MLIYPYFFLLQLIMLRIVRGLMGRGVRQVDFCFSKQENKVSKNSNYQETRKPLVKKIEIVEEKVEEEHPVEKIKLVHKSFFINLIMANITMGAALPFLAEINASIFILNAGFILNQNGHQIKKFLLYISNKHFQQLKNYQKPKDYLQIILGNMLFLSLNSLLVAFSYYPVAHLGTIAWYYFNIAKGTIPSTYWFMVFPLLFISLFSYVSDDIRKIINPTNIELLAKIDKKQ